MKEEGFTKDGCLFIQEIIAHTRDDDKSFSGMDFFFVSEKVVVSSKQRSTSRRTSDRSMVIGGIDM